MPLSSLGNRCVFKHMNFNGQEFLKTVSDSYFKVTFISGSENHQLHDNLSFFHIFHFHQASFMAFKSSLFEIFGKLL